MSLRTLTRAKPNFKIFQKPEFRTFQTILDFKNNPNSINEVITRSDKEIGGFSICKFVVDPKLKYGTFKGYLNLDLPQDNPTVTRSGYAMFRTKDQKESWITGESYWDWTSYDNLVLRVRGDARKYLVNVQANTPLITDLFQHRLYLNTPGNWETIVIPLSDFVMTNWGIVQNIEMDRSEIKTVGIGLVDKLYGPFKLDIDWIKVMTDEELYSYNT